MDIVASLLKIALLGSSWVLYLLLALSVVSIGAILERIWFFRKHGDDQKRLRKNVSTALLSGKYEDVKGLLDKSPSFPARIVRRALDWKSGGPEAVTDAVDSELGQVRESLEKSSSFLGTLGNNAPFIGLFGTVIGVIEAFHHLADGNASKAAMGSVMSGIAEALVATGVGIFVAIPAVVAYNVIQKKIGEIETGTNALTKLITAYLKTEERGGQAPVIAAASADTVREDSSKKKSKLPAAAGLA